MAGSGSGGPSAAHSSSSASAVAWISARPVSRPMGRAPDWHSFSPLYRAGLWDAVNMAPGASRLPAAK